MKTRQGFVSNSSTTSFCIYGIQIAPDEIRDIVREVVGEAMDYDEYLENHVPISVITDDYGDYYVEREWCDIGLVETGGQFMANVTETVNRVFPNHGKDFETHDITIQS
jgi:hypothetical protein